ncbi:MAG: hypothetical protein ABI467_30760 [Kofleriaceae bacterium]
MIFDVDDRGLPGRSLGSPQRLMTELLETAPALGIEVKVRAVTDAQVDALHAEADTGPVTAPYWRERLVWLTCSRRPGCRSPTRR